jgi:hypothetical protein
LGETTTGQPSRSDRERNAGPLLARTADMPARITGLRAAARILSGRLSPSAVKASTAAPARNGGRRISLSAASTARTLAGVVMCTGPGRSAMAVRNALRMIAPADSGTRGVAHLVTVEKRRPWSTY